MKIIEGILTREVSSNHYIYKHKAYGFDCYILDLYKNKNWYELQILTNTGRCYYISRTDFFKSSYVSNEFGKKQYILKVEYMSLLVKRGVKSIVISEDVHIAIKTKADEEGVSIVELMRKTFLAS